MKNKTKRVPDTHNENGEVTRYRTVADTSEVKVVPKDVKKDVKD